MLCEKGEEMSDLISRKALTEHIESEYRQWGEDYDAEQILGDIEDFPAALDLDKVIAELKELKTYKLDLADTMTEIMARGKSATYICLEDVIELLKNNPSDNAEPPKTD